MKANEVRFWSSGIRFQEDKAYTYARVVTTGLEKDRCG